MLMVGPKHSCFSAVAVQVATDVSRRNYAPGARSAPTDVGRYAIAGQSVRLPKQLVGAVVGLLLGVGLPKPSQAVTYYVSPTGSDTNTGSAALPWATIQKAANTMQAGDTAMVSAGSYDERVTTTRPGTAGTNRITFQAQGQATVRGFSIQHSYITVAGFDITRHSAASDPKIGYIEVLANANYFQVLNNTIRDGIFIVTNNLVFSSNSPVDLSISCATGGFLAAGFKPGQALKVYKADKNTALKNNGRSLVIQSVTDTIITLRTNQAVASEGPLLACLDASNNYGLSVHPGADSGLVRSNTFSNLSYDVLWCGGETNLYEFNTIERANGWNAFQFFGHDNLIRRNLIRTSPHSVFIPSPDVFETWGAQPAYNITLEENFVLNFDGALGAHLAPTAPPSGPIVFRKNVFVNAAQFVVSVQNVTYLNNTFFQIATGALAVVSADAHALEFATNANGTTLKNNIFVHCGDQTKNVDLHGWYGFSGLTNYVVDNNFVAGAAPGFAAKVGFNEGHPDLNGGDPGFVNIDDPLGPDGIPFSDDDGLRLRPDSKLRGKGEGGVDLGAYTLPAVVLSRQTNGNFRVTWPAWADTFVLQSAAATTGAWSNVLTSAIIEGDIRVVTVGASNGAAFYRLIK